MTLKQIEEGVRNKNNLTEPQKIRLSQAILRNKTARETALAGALAVGNFTLAAQIVSYGRRHTT